jgi:small subunit ribosomal protein S12
MATFNQLIKGARKDLKKYRKNTTKIPSQFRGLCREVKTMTPKKPNSALRKIAKVELFNTNFRKHEYGQKSNVKLKGNTLITYIGGEGHNLKEYSVVLIRKRNRKDLPGVRCEVIRGALDASGVSARRQGRSKYGAKKPEKK